MVYRRRSRRISQTKTRHDCRKHACTPVPRVTAADSAISNRSNRYYFRRDYIIHDVHYGRTMCVSVYVSFGFSECAPIGRTTGNYAWFFDHNTRYTIIPGRPSIRRATAVPGESLDGQTRRKLSAGVTPRFSSVRNSMRPWREDGGQWPILNISSGRRRGVTRPLLIGERSIDESRPSCSADGCRAIEIYGFRVAGQSIFRYYRFPSREVVRNSGRSVTNANATGQSRVVFSTGRRTGV